MINSEEDKWPTECLWWWYGTSAEEEKEGKGEQKSKGAFAVGSLGDSGLYNENETYSKQGKDQIAKSKFNFKGFDPNVQRKRKKKSTNAFKSKSKYKRR